MFKRRESSVERIAYSFIFITFILFYALSSTLQAKNGGVEEKSDQQIDGFQRQGRQSLAHHHGIYVALPAGIDLHRRHPG